VAAVAVLAVVAGGAVVVTAVAGVVTGATVVDVGTASESLAQAPPTTADATTAIATQRTRNERIPTGS
jgi:hypothetical protein